MCALSNIVPAYAARKVSCIDVVLLSSRRSCVAKALLRVRSRRTRWSSIFRTTCFFRGRPGPGPGRGFGAATNGPAAPAPPRTATASPEVTSVSVSSTMSRASLAHIAQPGIARRPDSKRSCLTTLQGIGHRRQGPKAPVVAAQLDAERERFDHVAASRQHEGETDVVHIAWSLALALNWHIGRLAAGGGSSSSTQKSIVRRHRRCWRERERVTVENSGRGRATDW